MIKLYVLKSSYSELPLCEIRTDGYTCDFVIDNTDGAIKAKVGKEFSKLKSLISNSSQFTLEEVKEPTVGLLRYVLSTGDVIEITTDGKTAILNGKFLTEQEKKSLFDAISRKEVTVERKADIEHPIPIFSLPKNRQETLEPPKGWASEISKELYEKNKNDDKIRQRASKSFDFDIENMDLRNSEDSNWVKQLMYTLKYGK